MRAAFSLMDKDNQELSALTEANTLLARLRDLTLRAEAAEARAGSEMASLTARHYSINETRYQIEILDRELKSLMRSRQAEIFARGDKVFLPAGLLIHSQETGLTLPRKAIGLIKAHGWLEAIRTSESLIRSVVESWPAERIAAIGGQERIRERYVYSFHDSRARA